MNRFAFGLSLHLDLRDATLFLLHFVTFPGFLPESTEVSDFVIFPLFIAVNQLLT